ncbi:unnamed protein product [Schistocephalus solidus]|uniref:Hflx-type G domain-containing protein n=1 Tax=Schistocephalus solidus TaxID=70667 RepID=A0A183T7W2_SCHSO|nr:unnamed protein product [Schistocephalus solidus]
MSFIDIFLVIRHAPLRRELDLNSSLNRLTPGGALVSQLTKGPDKKEAEALIDSVGGWSVGKVLSVNLRSHGPGRGQFFTKGVWQSLTQTVRKHLQQAGEEDDVSDDGEVCRKSLRFITLTLLSPAIEEGFNFFPLLSSLLLDSHPSQYDYHLIGPYCPNLTFSAFCSGPCFRSFNVIFPAFRYTLVILLFLQRSRTREAKAQAQLAELSLVRSRLLAITACDTQQAHVQNTDHLQRVLDNQQRRLQTILKEEANRRQTNRTHRRERTQNQWPVVAVVGYTNAGKTSLIRALSGSSSLLVSPRVFATTDITHHAARVPSSAESGGPGMGVPGLRLLFIDTIGFMADLPQDLIAAFRATLMECLDAISVTSFVHFAPPVVMLSTTPSQLARSITYSILPTMFQEFILHVIDVSQPGWQIFSSYIDQVLRDAGVHYATDDQVPRPISQCDEPGPRPCQPVLLRVGNKCDLGINLGVESPDFPLLPPVKLDAQVSCTTGSGLHHLCRLLESNLISIFGWRRKLVRMRQGSHALYWLYENSMVMSIAATADDPEKLECEVLFNRISWRLFQSKFFFAPLSNPLTLPPPPSSCLFSH